jgi:hypothetical protein
MKGLVIFTTCALALCAAQNVDPKLAKILKEQRFNAGDGRTGSAFATEDGHIFKEESDADGNRIGQYSYIGDDGQTYTVKYSAGVDGFRILSGDHVPSSGLGAAAFGADQDDFEEQPAQQPQQFAPVQEIRQVQPQRFAPVQEVRQVQPQQQFADYDDAPTNPFINPHDPTHRNFQFNQHAAQFNPNSPNTRQQSLVPECADCAGVNPFINPFDASHQQLADFGVAQARQQAFPAPAPAPRARPQKETQALPQILRTPLAEAVAKNFFPPGQLTLNRFENGFNFDFES